MLKRVLTLKIKVRAAWKEMNLFSLSHINWYMREKQKTDIVFTFLCHQRATRSNQLVQLKAELKAIKSRKTLAKIPCEKKCWSKLKHKTTKIGRKNWTKLLFLARVSDTAAFSSADRVGKQRPFGLVCSAIIEAGKTLYL